MSTIGAGLIIIACLWLVAIALCLILSRTTGALRYTGFIALVVALIVTLILWFLPRGPYTGSPPVVYDNTFVLRVALVTVLGFVMLVGFIVVGCLHIFDLQHGVRIK